jgi:hypothetical protein
MSNPQPLTIMNEEKQVQSKKAKDRGDFAGNSEEV